jgi:hypothetical protein
MIPSLEANDTASPDALERSVSNALSLEELLVRFTVGQNVHIFIFDV